MRHFKFLAGDNDWQTYGGKFYRQVTASCFYIIEVINWQERMGDDEAVKHDKYHVRLVEIFIDSHDDITSALRMCGWRTVSAGSNIIIDDRGDVVAADNDAVVRLTIEALYDHSGGDAFWERDGNNVRKLLAAAKRAGTVSAKP